MIGLPPGERTDPCTKSIWPPMPLISAPGQISIAPEASSPARDGPPMAPPSQPSSP